MAPLRAAALLLVALAMAPAQDPQQQPPVFRGRLETVAVPVTVFDPYQSLVTSLTRDDFTVYDNGKKQDITNFSSGLQPIRAVVLVDVSASMMPVIDLALMAAEQFVIRLRPDDKAKAGIFSIRVAFNDAFTADRDRLLTWLRQDLPFSKPTRLFDAIDEAVTALASESGRRVVMVFTDGCDTASKTGWGPILHRIYAEDVMVYAVQFRPRYALQAPPERVMSFGAPMGRRPPARPAGASFPCAFHHALELSDASPLSDFLRVDDPRWTRGPQLVHELASETGGGRLQLTPADDVNRLFTDIMKELHYMYLLGFAPKTLDGKVHELAVKLADPKLVVRARRHYVAPLAPAGNRPDRR